uniref:Retinal cone rhodopsin-sensitive cGMP 3',5'-cyclic phosphodiesterase subunit gamma n=1 Tax=Oncorhynchus tshawytscha TaxID=74940 RepID=A0AAZ3QZK7_ONCTS
MNTAPPAGSALATPAGTAGPTTPKKGPPKFKQRQTRTFKSKAPKPGQKGFGDDIPGMEGLGTGAFFVMRNRKTSLVFEVESEFEIPVRLRDHTDNFMCGVQK